MSYPYGKDGENKPQEREGSFSHFHRTQEWEYHQSCPSKVLFSLMLPASLTLGQLRSRSRWGTEVTAISNMVQGKRRLPGFKEIGSWQFSWHPRPISQEQHLAFLRERMSDCPVLSFSVPTLPSTAQMLAIVLSFPSPPGKNQWALQ